jgi:DNA-binding MarR family transcriptional regulator
VSPRRSTSTRARAGRVEEPSGRLVEVASDLRRVVGALHRRFRREQASGLTPSQWSLLVTIEAFGPLRLSDLAVREMVKPSTLTRSVVWLADRGLVERVEDPTDRRAIVVTATADGRRLVSGLFESGRAEFALRLERLPAEQRLAIARAMPVLSRLVGTTQGDGEPASSPAGRDATRRPFLNS